METIFSKIFESLFPSFFQEADLYEPFCKQVAAIQTLKLQDDLETVEKDEEDKEEIISDFLHDIHESFQKRTLEKDEDTFIDHYSPELINTEYENKIVVPIYRVRLSSKTGGKKIRRPISNEKVINPKTGNKISSSGRMFKSLVKEGLLDEEGVFTEKGQIVYDSRTKTIKVSNPSRKGGKININGRVFKRLIETEEWTFDDVTFKWSHPIFQDKNISTASSEEKIKIEHPVRKGQIVLHGRAFKKFIEKGYTFDEETLEWTNPE